MPRNKEPTVLVFARLELAMRECALAIAVAYVQAFRRLYPSLTVRPDLAENVRNLRRRVQLLEEEYKAT